MILTSPGELGRVMEFMGEKLTGEEEEEVERMRQTS